MITTSPPRYLPVKGPLSMLIIIQLLVAVILFVENTLNLTKNSEHFESEETRDVVFFAWLIVLGWILTVFCSLTVLFTNIYSLLIPHIVYTSLLSLLCVSSTILLFMADTRPWSMFLTASLSILLIVSVIYEVKCFVIMRERLS
uniref:MARVEL domain-containing protein n=1 Tax=Heterorhabditis bacteriophora TaxID=37862 RepID=A0A1I7XJW0_HETBA